MKFSLRPQRRRSARTGPSISLFPFLAVLICTMGALVPLLLAMMRTAHAQAEAAALARATEEAVQHESELRTAHEDATWRIEQVKKSRQLFESKLAEARLDLGHLEDHSRRLQAQLERYETTVRDLESIEKGDRQKQGQSAAELQQLRERIAAAQQQLGEARKAAAGRNRSYAVVPYDGPNQTRRRPIYLECCADAVVIQPEGIRLTDADFDGPMGPGNPLAAALRAAREHLRAAQQFDPQAGEPYPMLLVRPEGIGAYYAAREAMKSWGCDFGYELVGDDWKLAYPQPDPQLAGVVREAISAAEVAQARLIAAAPRQYARRSKPVYQASRAGGIVRVDGSGGDDDDRDDRPGTSASQVSRSGGGRGGRAGGSNGGDGRSYIGSGAGGFDRSGGGSYTGSGTGSRAGSASGNYGSPGSGYNPYAAIAERPATALPNGGAAGPAGSPSDGGPALGTPSGGSGASGSALVGGSSGGAGGANNSSGGNIGGGTGTGSGTGGDAGDGTGTNSYIATAGRSGTAGPGVSGGQPGNGGSPGGISSNGVGGNAAGGNGVGAGDGTGANPYVTNAQRPTTAAAGGGAPSGSPSNAAPGGVCGGGAPSAASQQGSNSCPSNSQPIERPDGYVVGRPQHDTDTTPPPRSDSQPSDDMATRTQLLRPGEWEPRPDPPPKPPEQKKDDPFGKKKPREKPRSLAERRGEDWGLRDAARGSVGVTRPIRIDCYVDRLVVLSDRNPANNKVVPLGPRTASSIDTFISEVWVHIEGWGIAGRGMYWRPVLQVAVAPDAEERFADLSALLDGSGLTVKRR